MDSFANYWPNTWFPYRISPYASRACSAPGHTHKDGDLALFTIQMTQWEHLVNSVTCDQLPLLTAMTIVILDGRSEE